MDSRTGRGLRRVIVDFASDADPVSGCVTTSDGGQAFSGWLELIQILDQARTATPQPVEERGPDEGEREHGGKGAFS
ncbi:hypothetical protein [Streptomyces sp. NPDC056479]|uniref:hypothetical protein n=1 Tax=unclassified Streptomyces TaxID=2593676 RepID=UPI00368E56B0